MTDEELLRVVSEITELNDLRDFLNDEHLDKALVLVVKLIVKQEAVPPHMIPTIIVKLQALATKFQIQAAVYKTIRRDKAGTENNHKKEIYYSLAESITKLVDALKYSAKYNG